MAKKEKKQEISFDQSNFFIMDRPKLENQGNLVIKTAEFHRIDEERNQMIQDCLFDIILNLGERLNEQDHDAALRMIIPTIVTSLYLEDQEYSVEKIKTYDEILKLEEDHDSLLDSDLIKMNAITRFQLNIFLEEKNKDLVSALESSDELLDDLEYGLAMVPDLYLINLIDFLKICEEKNSTKKVPKNKK